MKFWTLGTAATVLAGTVAIAQPPAAPPAPPAMHGEHHRVMAEPMTRDGAVAKVREHFAPAGTGRAEYEIHQGFFRCHVVRLLGRMRGRAQRAFGGEDDGLEDSAETRRLREEVRALKDRIQTLERITVDKESSLSRQIDDLRDR